MAQPVDYDQLKRNLEAHFALLTDLTALNKQQMISMLQKLQVDANASLDEFQGQISSAVWQRVKGQNGSIRIIARAAENTGTALEVLTDAGAVIAKVPRSIAQFFFGGEKEAYARLVTSPAQAAELARVMVETVKAQEESSWGRWTDVLSNIWSTIRKGEWSSLGALFSYAFSGDINAIENQAVRNDLIQTKATRVGVAIRGRLEGLFKADPAMGATIAEMASGIGAGRTPLRAGLIHQPGITVDEAGSAQVRQAIAPILPPPDKTFVEKVKAAASSAVEHPYRTTLYAAATGIVVREGVLLSRPAIMAGIEKFKAAKQGGFIFSGMVRGVGEAHQLAALRGTAVTATELAAMRARGFPNIVEITGDTAATVRATQTELATTARYAPRTLRGAPFRVAGTFMKASLVLSAVVIAADGVFSADEAAAVDRRIDEARTRGEITDKEAQIAKLYNAIVLATGTVTGGMTNSAFGSLAQLSGVPQGLRPASFSDLPAVEPRSTQHDGNWSPFYTVGEILAVAKAWDTTPPTHPIKRELTQKIPNLNITRLIRTLESNDAQDNAFTYGAMSDSRFVQIRKAVEPAAGMVQAYSDLYNRGPLYQRLIRDGFTAADIEMLLKANSPGFWGGNPDTPSEQAFRMIDRSGQRLAETEAGRRLLPATDIEWAAATPITNIDTALFGIAQSLSLRERAISSVVERPMGKLFDAFIDTYKPVAQAWADASLVQQVTVKAGGAYPPAVAEARAKFSRYWRDQGLPQSQIDAMLDLGTDMLLMGARQDAPQKIRDAFSNLIIYGPKDDLGNSIMANFVRTQPKLTNAEVARLVMSEPFRQWAIKQYGQAGLDMIEGQALFNVSSQRSGNKGAEWGSDRGLWGAGEYPGLAAHRRSLATDAERVAFDQLKERIFANLTTDFTAYMASEEGLMGHAAWLDDTLMKYLEKLTDLRQNSQATQQALYLAFIPKANEAEFQAQLTRLGIVDPAAVQHVTQLRAALQEKYQAMFKTDDRSYWQQFVDYINSPSPTPRMGIGGRPLPEAPADFNYRVDADKEMLMDMIVALMNRVKAAPQFGKVRVSEAEIPVLEQGGVRRMAAAGDEQQRLMRGLVEAAGGVEPRLSLAGAQVVGADIVALKHKLAFGNVQGVTGGDDVRLGASVVARAQPILRVDEQAEARNLGYSSLFS